MRGFEIKGRKEASSLSDFLIREYLHETYGVVEEEIVTIFKRYLTVKDSFDIKWHATIVTGEKAVIVAEDVTKLTRVFGVSKDARATSILKELDQLSMTRA